MTDVEHTITLYIINFQTQTTKWKYPIIRSHTSHVPLHSIMHWPRISQWSVQLAIGYVQHHLLQLLDFTFTKILFSGISCLVFSRDLGKCVHKARLGSEAEVNQV